MEFQDTLMQFPAEEIKKRLTFLPARNEEDTNAHEGVRGTICDAMFSLNALCPDGRDKALMMVKLEEAMFHGQAAIVRAHDN